MFETCCGNLFFYWNDPPMQKKSIILGHATLRRRKNPLFWDARPCGTITKTDFNSHQTCAKAGRGLRLVGEKIATETRNDIGVDGDCGTMELLHNLSVTAERLDKHIE